MKRLIQMMMLLAPLLTGWRRRATWCFRRTKGRTRSMCPRYPAPMQAAYKVFSTKCSKCHTIARPINTMMKRDEWERYVKRMMHKPNSGISDKQGKQIFEFLVFDQTERKDKNPKAFFPALSDEEIEKLKKQ